MIGARGRSFFPGLVACALCMLSANGTARADIIVDGNLSDWGVTPFTHWTPNAGTQYVVQGWPGGNYPFGGEAFVIQAMYVQSNATHLDVALVTNFPQAGLADPYGRPIHIDPGDLLLSVGTHPGQTWNYAVTLNGPNKGDIYYLPTLTLPQGSVGFPANGPSTVDIAHSSPPVGSAQVAWMDYGDLEGYGAHSYGIEVTADWAALGGWANSIALHNTMGCGNDAIDLSATVQFAPVPEPSTLAVLAIGGLTMAGAKWNARRRRVKI